MLLKIIFTIFLLTFSQTSRSQAITTGDVILGVWTNEEKDTRIEIYKEGIFYFGKLLWAQNLLNADGELRKDSNNSDKTLRNRSLSNVNLLSGFSFLDDAWEDGKMYDPKSGKTYSCTLKFRNNMLEIRSYVGIPLFGRTTYWKR